MQMHTIANEELDFMMLRRMSQDSSLSATEAELIQRLQRITVLTTNRFMYQGNSIFLTFLLKLIHSVSISFLKESLESIKTHRLSNMSDIKRNNCAL